MATPTLSMPFHRTSEYLPAAGWVVRVAFDLEILWNKPGRQATVFAEITDATLQALPAILNPSRDGYDDTAEDIAGGHTAVEDLFEALSCTRSTQ